MSKEERAMRALLNDVNKRFSKPYVIDNDKAAAYYKEQRQIEASIKTYQDKQEAEKRNLIEMSSKPVHIEKAAVQEMLDHVNKQIKANIRAEQAYLKFPQKDESYDHLEELHDMAYKQLIEAKAERTKAELLEDTENVEKLNQDIKDIEERLSFYSEQMKAIEGKDNG